MSIREEVLLDLLERTAEHMEHGMDSDAAFLRAAQDLEEDLRFLVAAERQIMRELGITVH